MSTEIGDKWSDNDDYALYQYEEIIEQNRDAFEKMTDALVAIRDERLYRNSHKTFSEYCEKRWKFTARWANRLIAGEKAVRSLENGNRCSHDLTPANIEDLKRASENAKSELTKTKPNKRSRVAKIALEKSGGKPPTKRHVQEAVMVVDHKTARRVAATLAKPPNKMPCSAYTVMPTQPNKSEPMRPPAVNGDPVAIVRACYEKHKSAWNAIPPAPPMLVVETICKALS